MKEEQESSWQATQESATGRTRTAEKGGGYRVGQRPRPTWRVLYPIRPCLSGFFLMTSSWMGSRTALPAQYFLHDLVMGGTSHNGSRHSYILYLVCFIGILIMLSLWFDSNISMCYFLQISLLWVHWTSDYINLLNSQYLELPTPVFWHR